jgi:hypothetical protein
MLAVMTTETAMAQPSEFTNRSASGKKIRWAAQALFFCMMLIALLGFTKNASAQAVSYYAFLGNYGTGTSSIASGVAVSAQTGILVALPGAGQVRQITGTQNGPNGSYSSNQYGSGFTTPVAVAVDGSGNGYVADTGANKIYEYVNSQLNTLASGFNNVSGVAVDGSGNVYVTDQGANKLYVLVASSGVVANNTTPTLLASGFNGPVAVAVDGSGNVYVADSTANEVEKIPASTISSILAGGSAITNLTSYDLSAPSGGWGNPAGVAVDQNNNVFASNADGAIYEMVAGSCTLCGSFQELASGLSAQSLAVDYQSNILITRGSSYVGVLATSNVLLGNGVTSVGNTSNSQSLTFTFNQATTLSSIAVVTGGLSGKDFSLNTSGTGACATGVEYGPSDSSNTCTVNVDFTPSHIGLRTGAVVLSTASGVVAPANLSGVGEGALMTLDSVNSANITVSSAIPYAYTVSLDAAGNQWVSALNGIGLYEIPQGSTTASAVTLPSFSGYLYSSAFDASGNMYLAEDSGVVFSPYKSSLSGPDFTTATTIVSQNQSIAGVGTSYLYGLAVGPDGTVYIADGNNARVLAYTPFTGQIGVRLSASSGLSFPVRVAVDAAGNLYVVDESKGVLVFSGSTLLQTISISTLSTYGISIPISIAVDASGSVLVGDYSSGNIVRIPLTAGEPYGNLNYGNTLLIETNPGNNANAFGIALDASGNLYAVNYQASGVVNIYNRTNASLSFTGYAGFSTPAQTVNVENAGTQYATFAATAITPPSTTYFTLTSSTAPECTGGNELLAGFTCQLSAVYTPTAATTTAQTDTASVNFTGSVAPANINLRGSATVDTTAVSVTVGTSPSSGPTITVNGGTAFTGSQVQSWTPGTSYTLAAQATETNAGVQYTFTGWSGSSATTNLSQTIEATPYMNSGATYTANFNTSYQLNISSSNSAEGSVSRETGIYYSAGSFVNIQATPNPGYTFVNWTGTGSSNINNVNSASTFITMSAPATITANFTAAQPAASLAVEYPTTVYTGIPSTGMVGALDSNGKLTSGFNGTVTVTTSESSVGIPVTLTNGEGSFTATFATAGTGQSITASYTGLTSIPETGITVTALPSLVVNTTADDTTAPSPATAAANCPANPSTTGAGSCTLRDALTAASSGGGAITFDATVFATPETITLGSLGTLNVPTDTTITGPTTGSGSTLTNLVTVDGNNQQSVDGSSSYTIFTTASGGHPGAVHSNSAHPDGTYIPSVAVIANLNIQHGNGGLDGTGLGESGGAGGINNNGTLTVIHCTFNANTGTDAGAIYNWDGQLTVNASTFTNNSSTGGWTDADGDWDGDAAAIFNDDESASDNFRNVSVGVHIGVRSNATGSTHHRGRTSRASASRTASPEPTFFKNSGSLTVSNSSFTGNSGVYTGGIYNYAQATVTGSTFGGTGVGAGNKSSGDGQGDPDAGALVNDTDYITSTATVTNSTFTNNSGVMGGAIASADAYDNGATLQVGYSTFVGNSSSGFSGSQGHPDAGAILSMWDATTEVGNSTFFNNSSTSALGAGALINYDGAIFEVYGGTITGNSGFLGGIAADPATETNLLNSIVSGNITTDPTAVKDNFSADNNGFFYKPNQGNIVGTSAITLAPLGNYGGATQTMIPLPGSTAICAGAYRMLESVYNNTGVTLTMDQRDDPNTNASYPGYTASAPCVDAGAVQTNYAITYTKPIPSSVTEDAAITPAPVVQLTESGTVLLSAASPITITDSATPSVLGGSTTANLSQGLATFSNLLFTSATSSDTLTATLALNSSLKPALNLTLKSTVSSTAPVITLSPATLPSGTWNTAYSQTITAGGGTAPYTYAVTVGTLPTGLTLSSAGLLSGSPTVSGPFSFTVQAKDSNSFTGIQAYTLTIAAGDFTINATTAAATVVPGGSAVFTFTVTPSGGTTFPTAVTFTASGLPAGATAIFSPSSIPAGSGATTVTMTISIPLTASAARPDAGGSLTGKLAPFALALLFLPFAVKLRRAGRRMSRMLSILLLVAAGAAVLAGMSGCGSNAGFFGQLQKSYTVGVTVTSGTITHTSNVTLTVE